MTRSTAKKAEAVGFVSYDGNEVSFSATSTGCTRVEHFHIEHEVQEGVCQVTVIRDKPDRCRRAPFIANFSVPWEPPQACQATEVVFTNPIIDTGNDSQGRGVEESLGRTRPRK